MANKNLDVANYWQQRYLSGKNSGNGSYGKLCDFKAKIINGFVEENSIMNVLEVGCGDGNQLSNFKIKNYMGVDISQAAIDKCNSMFSSDSTKSFKDLNSFLKTKKKYDLVLSLDVIFHLTDDQIYNNYLDTLFKYSKKYVIVYSSNQNDNPESAPHVKHRKFVDDIHNRFSGWKLIKVIENEYPISKFKNGSHSDFYIFECV